MMILTQRASSSTKMNIENTEKSKAPKPPKPEDKPFEEFINNDLIPKLTKALTSTGFPPKSIIFEQNQMPVIGGLCWIIKGELSNKKSFWLCFSSNNITSIKSIAISDNDIEPSVLESFLIDEKKITLQLLISRLLQRLNGQKWIGAN